MDTIVQIERFRYPKICGKRKLFHDLWIAALEKVKIWNHKGYCAPFFFFSEASTTPNSVENTRSVLLF